jgi:hypothetical protein
LLKINNNRIIFKIKFQNKMELHQQIIKENLLYYNTNKKDLNRIKVLRGMLLNIIN